MTGFIEAIVTGLGAATGGTTAVATGTTAASTGLSISSILQGVATVGGIVATIAAGNAESAALKAQARDAEAEKGFETLQSIDRKRSLLAAANEAKGELDVAYAGSGVDLSFGSAAQQRQNVYREADLGLETDSATTALRLDRLTERARNFRKMAKRTKLASYLSAGVKGLQGFSSLQQQY
jgi:hypothetical protein